METLLYCVVAYLVAGCAALLGAKSPRWATLLGAGGAATASLIGLFPAVAVLTTSRADALSLSWDVAHGAFAVEIDRLTAFFLVPVLGLSALAAVYGGDYLWPERQKRSLGVPWFFFNLFVAGMVLVLVARTAVVFLMAWELMSLSAYFLVTMHHDEFEVRYAGWVYLIATHIGAAFLFFAFVLLGSSAQSLEFAHFGHVPVLTARVVFTFALIGFGAKAGFVPFHVWLPEAHSAAPSHVSSLMSGVMIKMGLYGLLRVLTILDEPEAWWGPTLALLGLVTALIGICLALHPRDTKRVLAYSSIENVGLIALALGVALTGKAHHDHAIAVLGMTAALIHVWNHSLMKGLMFLSAGSVLHATGTRDMERLGGLMKRMPRTATAMLTGAVALAALPPLNGFVGKWLIYLGLIRDGMAANGALNIAALLVVGLLALIGGLAAITFLRLVGIVLLGSPRSEEAAHAHEASPWMIGPMLVLVGLCFLVALFPRVVADLLFGIEDQLFGWADGRARQEFAATQTPLDAVGIINAVIVVLFLIAGLALWAWSRRRGAAEGPTWGCGYTRPTVRMQYTGRSFGELIIASLLPQFLRPRVTSRPSLMSNLDQGAHAEKSASEVLFPAHSEFATKCPDPVNEKVYEPFFHRWADWLSRLRIVQHGKVHFYLVYMFAVVIMAFAWLSIRRWWGT